MDLHIKIFTYIFTKYDLRTRIRNSSDQIFLFEYLSLSQMKLRFLISSCMTHATFIFFFKLIVWKIQAIKGFAIFNDATVYIFEQISLQYLQLRNTFSKVRRLSTVRIQKIPMAYSVQKIHLWASSHTSLTLNLYCTKFQVHAKRKLRKENKHSISLQNRYSFSQFAFCKLLKIECRRQSLSMNNVHAFAP